MALDLNIVVVILAILSPILSVGIVFGRISMKIKYLEKKMDKHNLLLERMIELEHSVKLTDLRIDDIGDDIRDLEQKRNMKGAYQ